MKKILGVVLVASTLISGCSIVPYEDEYACNMPDSLGKCQNMTDSYQEAVTGVETAEPMQPVSKRDDDAEGITSVGQATPPPVIQAEPTSYDRYIDGYYSQLQRLIVSPKNPVIQQPTQIRMLVLPYSSHDQSVMYMHRHIYWVHQKPHFVLGDYMKKPSEILDNPMMPSGSN